MAYKKLKYWFDSDLATMIANKVKEVFHAFPSDEFHRFILSKIEHLELKGRVEVFADALEYVLPGDYPAKLTILMQTIGNENPGETGMFTEYYWLMPHAKFIEKYGLTNFELSMEAIEEITKRNTGEYAIRPFIEKNTARTISQMLQWSQNGNFHVRRLASEGVRPRLPWARTLQMFIDNPDPILPILENLKNDSSKYVQKSVANCLNDISKDNPSVFQSVVDSWIGNTELYEQWILKHALRNFAKQNNSWALDCLSKLK